jgi:hypothetical protein
MGVQPPLPYFYNPYYNHANLCFLSKQLATSFFACVLECGGKRSATPLSNGWDSPNRMCCPIRKRRHSRRTPKRKRVLKHLLSSGYGVSRARFHLCPSVVKNLLFAFQAFLVSSLLCCYRKGFEFAYTPNQLYFLWLDNKKGERGKLN